MNDKLDHFVLEYDRGSGCALLSMTKAAGSRGADGERLPYAVARGYDASARTWESIEFFDDVTRAKLRFEKACGREYVPAGGKLYDDEFITLRWRRKDIADSLEDDWGNFGFPIPATEENVEWAMDQLGNHIDDAIHAAGWGIIHDCLDPNSFDLGVGHSVQEVHVDNFAEKPEEVRFFLRTDADVYLFGSSLGKSLEVEDRAGEDIAPALREVRTYCKDATEKRDPQLICAKAQAAAAKSATAEGEAGGKKL